MSDPVQSWSCFILIKVRQFVTEKRRTKRNSMGLDRSSSRFTALTLGPAWWTGLILIWSEHVWSCPDFPNLSRKIQPQPAIFRDEFGKPWSCPEPVWGWQWTENVTIMPPETIHVTCVDLKVGSHFTSSVLQVVRQYEYIALTGQSTRLLGPRFF